MDSLKPLKILLCLSVALSTAYLPGCTSAPRRITLQEAASQMLLENPTEPFRWVEYGRACEEAMNDLGAIKAYERALELDGRYTPAYEHLGAIHSKLGEHDLAKQTYRRAFDEGIESPLLWLGYGYCLAELKAYDSALLALQNAESLAEADVVRVSALLGRAAVLVTQNERERAEAAIRAAAAIDGNILSLLGSVPIDGESPS